MNDHQVMAAVALLVVFAVAIRLALGAARKIEALQERVAKLEAELQEAREHTAQLAQGVSQAAGACVVMQQRIDSLSERQEQLRHLDEESGSYRHAIRLAREGGSVEQLVQDCGLNRGEAELVIALHGAGTGAGRA